MTWMENYINTYFYNTTNRIVYACTYIQQHFNILIANEYRKYIYIDN